MPREHDDLITLAKNEGSIEGALETVLYTMAGRWNQVARTNDYGKGAAMSQHLSEDMQQVVTAIMDHSTVFKPEPKVEPSRASELSGTPKTAERETKAEDAKEAEEAEEAEDEESKASGGRASRHKAASKPFSMKADD